MSHETLYVRKPELARSLDLIVSTIPVGREIKVFSADFKELKKLGIYGWKGHPIVDGGPRFKRPKKRPQENLM